MVQDCILHKECSSAGSHGGPPLQLWPIRRVRPKGAMRNNCRGGPPWRPLSSSLALPDSFTNCCRCAATRQNSTAKNKQIASSPLGTLIANTEFVLSATHRRSDYAKTVSHGPINYAAAVFSCLVAQAQAVSVTKEVPPYEIGGQLFSFRGGNDLGFGWGAGGRFTYNLNNYIAFDNEVNFFLPDEGPPYATQGLFGIKAGKHFKYVGIFAKARPGFQTNLIVNDREQTRFAMDVGVVGELSYSSRSPASGRERCHHPFRE